MTTSDDAKIVPNASEGFVSGKTSTRTTGSVTRSERRFDVTTLPVDMLRVYRQLEDKYGEEYALTVMFNMRTAIELHRAWHMTLLTSKVLQQVKDKFELRMTWNLGVIRNIFRFEDGGFELHRKVPYDYDSEYQDLYMKIATALVGEHISVHEALIFQTEVKQGLHTAQSGLFIRDFPGRLVLYPFLSSTCAVIFFGGDGRDCWIAAITGLATGLFEYFLSTIGGQAKVLIDVFAGMVTGIIGGLFFRYDSEDTCLSAIFLGTLYWFFYGTAFVLGLLEIIAGELETGVTRFMAVSIKTFVLCLSASLGMLMVLKDPAAAWNEQSDHCGTIDLDDKWWRIPLYLACSAAALGQYRFPVIHWWRGLCVQLAGYEVQYQLQKFLTDRSGTYQDNVDTMTSNIMGAAAAVVAACTLSHIVDSGTKTYYSQLLQRGKNRLETESKLDDYVYAIVAMKVKFENALMLGRKSEVRKIALEKKLMEQTNELKDPGHARSAVSLDLEEEALLVDTIVCAESINIWSMLMPTVYQLVPGSMIAKLWFNSIFPPPLLEEEGFVLDSDGVPTGNTYTRYSLNSAQDNVFSNLMVIAASLAVGLIVGFALVQTWQMLYTMLAFWESDEKKEERMEAQAGLADMYTSAGDPDDDPGEEAEATAEATNGAEVTSDTTKEA